MKAPTSVILWSGPSALDGAPIAVIATGITRKSSNRKTGPMVQLWIIRSDVDPINAVATGRDASVCGDCPYRGILGLKARPCYVSLRTPRRLFQCFQAGRYPTVNAATFASMTVGRAIRFGAYGDPAAVPSAVWTGILNAGKAGWSGWTGYTHQWRKRPEFRGLLMASVDTEAEAFEARSRGFRTFRVSDDRLPDETRCPADMGKTQCANCQLCDGSRGPDVRANIQIPAHGPGSKALRGLLVLQ